MKTRFFKNIALFGGLAASLLASSCTGDLDRTPFIEVTSATVYNDPAAYKQAAAKLYAGLALTGQEGMLVSLIWAVSTKVSLATCVSTGNYKNFRQTKL
jgi:hypothetical protein